MVFVFFYKKVKRTCTIKTAEGVNLTSRKLTMDSCSRRRRNRISRISERTLRLSEVRSMRSCLIATRCLVLLSSAEYTLDWPANLGCQAGTQIMQLQGRKRPGLCFENKSLRRKWASDPWRAALDIWIRRGARQAAHIYRPVVPRTLPLKPYSA